MTISPGKFAAVLGVLTFLTTINVKAQTVDDAGRDASFLPPPGGDNSAVPAPSPQMPQAAPIPITPPAPPLPVINAPSLSSPGVGVTPSPVAVAPAALPSQAVSTPPAIISPPVAPAPAAASLPTAGVPTSGLPPAAVPPAVSPATSPPPVSAPPAVAASPSITPTTVAPAPVTHPVEIAKPVESGTLSNIDPDSIGLLSPNEGGLGAAMWKGTPRDLVEHLMPSLNLPVVSPTLNHLAQRFLLTIADVPAGKKSDDSISFTAMRVRNLVSVGDVKDAWSLAQMVKPDQIDEATLRMVIENGLAGDMNTDICAKLPDIIKSHSDPEWQKSMVVCQLIAKDNKAAQLTLDLMRNQNVRDDTFFYIVERNIFAGSRQLPRQLTPLKPLTLALLKLADIPLPGEVYAHPDASLIPALLTVKAKDDNIRLLLAERSAERGIITAAQLEAVYAGISFLPEVIAGAANSTEAGVRLHALLYQAAIQEKDTAKRLDLAAKLLHAATAPSLNGTEAQVLADMIGTVPAGEGYNASSSAVARIYMGTSKPGTALEWIKQAQHASAGMPWVAQELQVFWPLEVFAGTESDTDYARDLGKWIDAALTLPDPKDDNREQREHVATILLLLDADGFAVPEEYWARVVTPPNLERHLVPSALLLERLRAAGSGSRKGEVVLYSLLLANNGNEDMPFISTLVIIRALRLAGLTSDAGMLAREAATLALMPPAKP